MKAPWSYSIGTSSGSRESEPVPSGSEIPISDKGQSRAAPSNLESDVQRPISKLERELFVKLADPIQSL